MNLDATFRPFVLGLFFIIVLVVLPYRLRSQATREKLDRTQEGIPMLITLRLASLVVALGVFAFMIDPARMASASIPLPASGRWTGFGITAITVE